jgi:hypothetical protein
MVACLLKCCQLLSTNQSLRNGCLFTKVLPAALNQSELEKWLPVYHSVASYSQPIRAWQMFPFTPQRSYFLLVEKNFFFLYVQYFCGKKN